MPDLFPPELLVLRQGPMALQAAEATTREQLHVAAEKLRQQQDELAKAHGVVTSLYQRYQAFFALAHDGYLVTDALGMIEEANQAAETLLGVMPGTLVGKPLIVYIAQEDRPAFRTQLTRLRAQTRGLNWELVLHPTSGRTFPAELTVAVSQGAPGTPPMLHWLLRDLSTRKQMEADLRRAEHLALLGKLAASITHDIRNPLSALFLQMEVLTDELAQLPAALTAPMTEPLATIHTALTCLHTIVEDYLSLARLEHLQLLPADLGAFMAAFAQEIQPVCTTRGIMLVLEGTATLGTVALHANTLHRAMLNLVQNALDAMPEGGTLTLRGHHTTAQVTLEVQDTGSGIPAAQLPHLFTPLRTTKPDGTGLGLYIAQEILRAHGGSITVESVPGGGTTFTLTLPCVLQTG